MELYRRRSTETSKQSNRIKQEVTSEGNDASLGSTGRRTSTLRSITPEKPLPSGFVKCSVAGKRPRRGHLLAVMD